MSAQPPQVLIVDDNEMNRDMLARRLERLECQTVTAEDGLQALELLPNHSFDLILLDIMMPRMTGYEVLERVKGDPATRHIPVIMISAVDDLESVVKCVEKGADDYLFKPFNPILLKARISASLEKKRLRDQEQQYLQQGSSTADANKRLVRSFFENLTNARIDGDLTASNFIFNASGKTLSGEKLLRVFSGTKVGIQDIIAEGEKVVTQLMVQPDGAIIAVISRVLENRIVSQSYFSDPSDWLNKRLS